MKLEISLLLAHHAHDLDPIRAQHAAVVAQRDAGRARDQPVHRARGEAPERAVVAVLAPAAHHVGARVERRDQARDLAGRVLEVRVERHDRVGGAAREAREHRRVLSEVAREPDRREARIAPRGLLEQRPRPVAAAVVDDDRAPRDRERREVRVEPLEQARQHRLLVEDRDHEVEAADRRHRATSRATSRIAPHTRATSASSMPGNSGSDSTRASASSRAGGRPRRSHSARGSSGADGPR